MKKKVTKIIFVITLCFTVMLSNSPFYASASNENLAKELKELGLFLGTGNGFDLEKPCDRLVGAVILVRFLGYEDEALSHTNTHPFQDVTNTYANNYIGNLYAKGLAKGQTNTAYGTGKMTANQFSTFMLRALGYEDNIDFTWDKALLKMNSLGIISSDELTNIQNNDFTRDDAVLLCYKTLLANLKGQSKTLVNKLLWEDVFTTDQLSNTLDGSLMIAADMPDLIPNHTVAKNAKEVEELILLSMRNDQLGVGIDAKGMNKEQLTKIYDDIISLYHWKSVPHSSLAHCWNGFIYPHINTNDYLDLEYYYENPDRYQKNYKFYRKDLISATDNYISLSEWVDKVNSIVDKNIKDDMTEQQKVKALHDFIVLNAKYDGTYEGGAINVPHYAETIIFEGHGVCDGYAEAYKILLNGAGIDCKVIYGNTPNGLHAWNQVKIDNKWYNVDVTWDDPDSGDRILYDYYCLPDSKFSVDHWPEKISNPETCTSELQNGEFSANKNRK